MECRWWEGEVGGDAVGVICGYANEPTPPSDHHHAAHTTTHHPQTAWE